MKIAGTFQAIASVARKEFIHILRDWRILILIFTLPPAFTLLLGHAFEVTELTDAPALLFDGIQRKLGNGRDWRLSLLLGAGFVLALLAVSWPLSAFLLSPAARNPVFLADQWDFSIRPGAWQYEYWQNLRGGREHLAPSGFAKMLMLAALIAALSARVGLALGSWMRKVKR